MGLGPYLKSTPRHWFFRTTGPVLSPLPPPAAELLPILALAGRSVRPRTMPESHDVVVEDEDDEDEEEEEWADDRDDKEVGEVGARFMSTALIHLPLLSRLFWICRGQRIREERHGIDYRATVSSVYTTWENILKSSLNL
jgi:hypothetical protein